MVERVKSFEVFREENNQPIINGNHFPLLCIIEGDMTSDFN